MLPYGHVTGLNADDHVHIDLGYITVIPREISEDRMEVPQENRPRFAFEDRGVESDRRGRRIEVCRRDGFRTGVERLRCFALSYPRPAVCLGCFAVAVR